MPVVVVGLHERDCPLEVLEKVAFADRDLEKALQVLLDSSEITEAVIVSTCLRTEVYAVLERFHEGLADVTSFFNGRLRDAAGAANDLEEQLFVAYEDAAVRHLFEVASGLDSAVLGEGEILRQVRHAADTARGQRAAGPLLVPLFRHALEVGKRARTETALAQGTTSLAHIAVELATEHAGGSLENRRVVVVGAGEMGQGVATALSTAPGRPEVVVANRSRVRARTLAASVGARPVALSELASELALADVLISATAGDGALIDTERLAPALVGRSTRPLVIVDAAVPRDVDPAVATLRGVRLFDVDDLRRRAEAGMASRRGEISSVTRIIDEELERYRQLQRSRSVAPLVASLRDRVDTLVKAELDRQSARLGALGTAERELVAETTRRVVQKLLHEPTVQLKSAAGTPRGERLAEALRALFDL